ncbi:MAG: hypothetical protein R3F11_20695 [Verrucomicrobiales bacterium]
MRPTLASLSRAAALGTVLLAAGAAPAVEDYELAPISYWDKTPADALAQLKGDLESGAFEHDPADEKSFLRNLLKTCGVPESSQVLVFSKTSFQNSLISPRSPRALYFNDDLYIGWVPGGDAEVIAMDPELGAVFYHLKRHKGERPTELLRSQQCMDCHQGSRVGSAPGPLVRSVYPDSRGFPILSAGSFVTAHDSPLSERWGGWYVTGTHGSMRHMGNALAEQIPQGADIDIEAGANCADLTSHFDTAKYLQPTSDIVALMVMEHQIGAHNLFNQGSYAVRSAIFRRKALDKELGEPDSDGMSDLTKRIIDRHAEKIVRHLLFAGEFRLTDKVESSSPAFLEAFAAQGPRDPEGRSLRDFQLITRLFEYRCSYMIYSKSFDAIPAPLKDAVFHKLHAVLAGQDQSDDFAQISMKERRYILEILAATKPGLFRAPLR